MFKQTKLMDAKFSLDNMIDIGCKIGNGTFGLSELYFAKYKNDALDQTLLVMRKTKIERLSTEALQELQKELQLSKMVACPGILSFFCTFVKDEYICTLFPLYNYGSCHDLISSEFRHGLPIQLVAVIIRSIILALEYLHDFSIIHRAVKASHILLNSDGNVCLSGLSYSLLLPKENGIAHDYPKHAVQMLPWISPEILQQNITGYSYLSDIYSLGVTIFELATGTVPFLTMKPTEILLQKLCGIVPQFPDCSKSFDSQSDFVTSQSSLDGLENDSTEYTTVAPTLQKHKRIKHLQQLVDACLQTDPSARPSAYQLRHCLYIRHVKRKQKEKEFPSFSAMLNPLKPVTQFIPADGPSAESITPTAILNNAWVFPC